MNKIEALNLLKAYLKNEKLIKHCLAVGKIMEKLAERLNEDVEKWYITGLLHDIDYEMTSIEKHGLVSENILKGKVSEDIISAIKAHNEFTGYKDESNLAIALKCADAVSGLIIATALVMPDKKLNSVKLETLKNKFKQKDFARNVSREKIKLCEKIGISLEEFLEISLNALKEIDKELGL
jgi:putative nucleotidyltransferase with HDIG domain